MPGRDGTGPMGYGPMTGGRRGFCGDAAAFPGRGGGRGRRNQFYATGLTGWQRARRLTLRRRLRRATRRTRSRASRRSSPKCSSAWIASSRRRATDMGERGPGGGGRGGRGGRGQGSGQGMRQRRRDGSGRGACLGPATGAGITRLVRRPPLIASAPGADVPANAPAVVSRARTVAIVAEPESCIACGTCVETCPRDAITLDETAVIDASICTGCGLCVSDCAYGALALAEV